MSTTAKAGWRAICAEYSCAEGNCDVMRVLQFAGQLATRHAREQTQVATVPNSTWRSARRMMFRAGPDDGLRQDDLVAVERGCRRTIEFVAKRQRFADPAAESRIVRTGQCAIHGQVVWRMFHGDLDGVDGSRTQTPPYRGGRSGRVASPFFFRVAATRCLPGRVHHRRWIAENAILVQADSVGHPAWLQPRELQRCRARRRRA